MKIEIVVSGPENHAVVVTKEIIKTLRSAGIALATTPYNDDGLYVSPTELVKVAVDSHGPLQVGIQIKKPHACCGRCHKKPEPEAGNDVMTPAERAVSNKNPDTSTEY